MDHICFVRQSWDQIGMMSRLHNLLHCRLRDSRDKWSCAAGVQLTKIYRRRFLTYTNRHSKSTTAAQPQLFLKYQKKKKRSGHQPYNWPAVWGQLPNLPMASRPLSGAKEIIESRYRMIYCSPDLYTFVVWDDFGQKKSNNGLFVFYSYEKQTNHCLSRIFVSRIFEAQIFCYSVYF